MYCVCNTSFIIIIIIIYFTVAHVKLNTLLHIAIISALLIFRTKNRVSAQELREE